MGRKNKKIKAVRIVHHNKFTSLRIFFPFEDCFPHIETFSNFNPLADKTSI